MAMLTYKHTHACICTHTLMHAHVIDIYIYKIYKKADGHVHVACVCSDSEGEGGEATPHPDQHHEEHPALPAAAVREPQPRLAGQSAAAVCQHSALPALCPQHLRADWLCCKTPTVCLKRSTTRILCPL